MALKSVCVSSLLAGPRSLSFGGGDGNFIGDDACMHLRWLVIPFAEAFGKPLRFASAWWKHLRQPSGVPVTCLSIGTTGEVRIAIFGL